MIPVKLIVVLTVTLATVTVAVPDALSVTVCEVPLFMLYVTVAFGVPFIVKVPVCPEQIGELVTLAEGAVSAATVTGKLAVQPALSVTVTV